ncbi:monocarboxylate transporter 2-like [Scleropages formosus]|uniref:Monocarboxylate transporter 2-like n=2 Tax=Scleropages formosus TaxID=113540 RepID=A0A0P7WRU7_SCLFO|nr:monocarboxylate transporter 2-like [Scleropages formosus]
MPDRLTMPSAPTTDLGYTPPDGGWGWVVVFGAFISIGFSYAFPKALTIYFKEIQEYFSVSYSDIAWISSIMLAAMYAGGPASSVLVNRYGSRPVVMAGGIMCGVAMVTASFGNTITHLYVCVGVIGGFGLSFNLQPSLTIIGKYFLAKRPVANGLAMAGSPVFLSALAPLNQFLFDSFGWRDSFFILGALLLNCCVAGALMRPIGEGKAGGATRSAGSNKGSVPRDADPTERERKPGAKNRSTGDVSKLMDFSLFRHRGFLIYLVGNAVMFFGFFAPIVFLAPYAKHQGVDEYSAASLLSILAAVDMIARPGTGLLANTRWIRPRIQYLFSFAVTYNGVCNLLCPLAMGYGVLVAYSLSLGVAFGMVCALLFECLMDLVGARRFSSAVGLVTVVECCPVLLGPPVGGVLVDIFGDYMYMHFMSGAVMFASGLFLFVMNFWNYRLEESKTRSQKGAVEQAEMKRLSALEQGSARGADGFEMPEQEEKGEGDRTRVHPLP